MAIKGLNGLGGGCVGSTGSGQDSPEGCGTRGDPLPDALHIAEEARQGDRMWVRCRLVSSLDGLPFDPRVASLQSPLQLRGKRVFSDRSQLIWQFRARRRIGI